MLRQLAASVVVVSASLTSGLAGTSASGTPSGPEILNGMVAAYATLATYRDSGEVRLSQDRQGENVVERIVFSTAFVRPELFRFEFEWPAPAVNPKPYVVWSNGQGARSWWALRPGIREFDSIEFALGGPTGISHRSATRIPGLLMPNMLWGSGMRHLERPVLLGEEKVGASDCYKLEVMEGVDPGRPMTLWLDMETYLVRKVHTSRNLPGGTRYMTALYSPHPNVEIPAQDFDYQPPY